MFGSLSFPLNYFIGVGRAGIALGTAAKDPQLSRRRLTRHQLENFVPLAKEKLGI